MRAPVNKIIDHSIVDGDGNRTAIFFQGCPFSCLYCHNPETISLCQKCGACVSHCPVGALRLEHGEILWREDLCVGCDSCLKVCPHNSSPKVREMTVEEVMDRVEQNRPFIRGITCSGGECTLYADFMTQLFQATRERGLTNLVDSNGTLDFSQADDLMAVCDGVMLDLKCFDRQAHIRLTGKDNDLVLANARWLASQGKLPEIRTVVIPGELPNQETVREVCKMLSPYLKTTSIRYKLIRFRPWGVREPYKSFPVPDDSLMEELRQIALSYGFTDVLVV